MKAFLLTSFLCFFILTSFSQTASQRGALHQAAFRIDSLPANGVLLDKNWKWHAGDNPNWAKSNFDDSKWDTLNPTSPFSKLPQVTEAEMGWFRLSFTVDSSLLNQPFIMAIKLTGAFDIYLNGKLVHKIGKVSKDPIVEETMWADLSPANFVVTHTGLNTLAFRYSLTKSNFYFQDQLFFSPIIKRLDGYSTNIRKYYFLTTFSLSFMAGLTLIMGILHLCFYYFYPLQKANFKFGLSLVLLAIALIVQCLPLILAFKLSVLFISTIADDILQKSHLILLLAAICQYTKQRFTFLFPILVILDLIQLVIWFLRRDLFFNAISGYFILIIGFSYYIYVSYKAMKASIENAKFIFYGGIFSIVLFIFITILNLYSITNDLFYNQLIFIVSTILAIISIPISLSLALARDFAQTSFSLQRNLEEVKHLSEEKQQILSSQNETLEKQVEQRTAELKAFQNQLIQKEKLASLGELTAGIAHEIQNPLNFVNNFSELSTELIDEMNEEIERGDTQEVKAIAGDLKQNLEKINYHGKRASSIVKGMLEHSRTGTGERQLTDINQLADEYLRLSYHGLRAKDSLFNSDYELITDENLPKINVVSQEIGRVLLNLINNAFYAVNERSKLGESDYKPKVIVTTQLINSQLKIAVQDNGMGMSDATKAKIFQPFFTTKPTGEGTGLGLSLAYDIVTKGHGGTFEVESEQGQGSEFSIQLPI
jgi:two-component system NtrC family sensor kinase